MHRSGTSLVASWLEGCGLQLYDKVGAHIGNPLGHYEDGKILKVHMAALSRIRKKSKGWIVDRTDGLVFSNQEKMQLAEIVNQRAGKTKVWGWKEPRASLFLNEWKEMVPDIKTILLWRSCDLVVDSLIRRSNRAKSEPTFYISCREAVKNWKIYNTKIYDYHKNNSQQSIMVNIDFLLRNSCNIMREVNRKFDLQLSETDIGGFYKNDMINREAVRVSSSLKFYKRIHNIKSIENKLIDVSVST